jgi:hypothetical protein
MSEFLPAKLLLKIVKLLKLTLLKNKLLGQIYIIL